MSLTHYVLASLIEPAAGNVLFVDVEPHGFYKENDRFQDWMTHPGGEPGNVHVPLSLNLYS
jgi:hypothetical protein